MKFELKTEKDNYSKSFLQFFGIIFFLTLIIIICDVAFKLGTITRNHEIEYNCRLLSLEKSKTYFKNHKKRPHICGAGWWGTLFLDQILKKCNPLSVAQVVCSLYTTGSALMIFLSVN